MENNQFEVQEEKKDINIIGEVMKYLNYWYWFLIMGILFFLGAKLYLRYTPDIFESNARIKILDNASSGFKLPDAGISIFGKTKINLDNEIQVLKSSRMMQKVVDSLGLTTRYSSVGYFTDFELWQNKPISIQWLENIDTLKNKQISFKIEINKNGYTIVDNLSSQKDKIIKFNEIYTYNGNTFKVKLNNIENFSSIVSKQIKIDHISSLSAVSSLTNSVKIVTVSDQSEILQLSINGTNKEKNKDILNEVIRQFNIDGIDDRKFVSQRTIDFVNQRFVNLTKQLDSIEDNKASYKRNNELSFLESDASASLSNKESSEGEVFRQETQIELAKYLQNAINQESGYGLLPNNIGVTSININDLISTYNTAILEYEKFSTSGAENHPKSLIYKVKLNGLKINILESLNNYMQELRLSLKQLSNQQLKNKGIFGNIPTNEKILNGIERQRAIKETLYILLLQKREEAAINLAITGPSVKVVDYAITNSSPIAPQRSVILLTAFLIGLLIPFVLLYIKFMLDNKIHTKHDVTAIIKDIPVVSEIPYISEDDKILKENDRSILAESFRILRTNVNYLLHNKQEGVAPIIYVTSTIKGEGKTFTSLNLAMVLATMDKKVLLVGSDLRNPQLHTYTDLDKENKGLSNYLYDTSINWKDLIVNNQFNNKYLNILPAGSIPPNPAELLSNGRFVKLIEEAKSNFDYIIVDTAPTLLVTDTLTISQLADVTLYVLRADYTDKKLLQYSKELKQQGKLKNIAYVLNNVGSSESDGYRYGYGYGYSYAYGYGYGYGADANNKLPWYKKITHKFFKK